MVLQSRCASYIKMESVQYNCWLMHSVKIQVQIKKTDRKMQFSEIFLAIALLFLQKSSLNTLTCAAYTHRNNLNLS